MPVNYQKVRFTRAGSVQKERGVYLDACTSQSGDYLPQRIVTLDGDDVAGTILEVIPVKGITFLVPKGA